MTTLDNFEHCSLPALLKPAWRLSQHWIPSVFTTPFGFLSYILTYMLQSALTQWVLKFEATHYDLLDDFVY